MPHSQKSMTLPIKVLWKPPFGSLRGSSSLWDSIQVARMESWIVSQKLHKKLQGGLPEHFNSRPSESETSTLGDVGKGRRFLSCVDSEYSLYCASDSSGNLSPTPSGLETKRVPVGAKKAWGFPDLYFRATTDGDTIDGEGEGRRPMAMH